MIKQNIINAYSNAKFLLVEPIAKTPYPPLGLMRISSMLKGKFKGCEVLTQVGMSNLKNLVRPDKIFITSLFTWDLTLLIETINHYREIFPNSEIIVGGISASLFCEDIYSRTGVKPHFGLYEEAEFYPPDYSLTFGRKNNISITFTTRGCINTCKFCNVKDLEPVFMVRDYWEIDIEERFPQIIFWDNNFLASPKFQSDCEKISVMGKRVDFNQGLDARLIDEEKAQILFGLNLNPIRFAFDDVSYEADVLRAIRLAKKYSTKEVIVYVLYNFNDTPEDFFYRINLLNKEGALSFPMEYRAPTTKKVKLPGIYWNTFLLRALKLSLMFYYRKGMITLSRESFQRIYGKDEKQFVSKLYEIYMYDKALNKKTIESK